MSSKKSAVCYLTRVPDAETIEFAEQLAKDSRISSNVDIHIMIDDNNYKIQPNSLIKFVQIDNNECISNGYHSSNKIEMHKDCISWDKAIYYFCQVKRNDYSFVWLIEDDSFIPSVDAFVLLHEKYSQEGNGDLICQKNDENLYGDTSGWKWADVVGKFSPPWYHSMVCAIGCSRKLLDGIANYVQQRRFLPFIEYMFNTIAMQNHLKVVNPPELSTIIFRENWTWDHIRQRPNNWFHPFKSQEIRRENRLRLANAWQEPSQNVAYQANTGYQAQPVNTGYQAQPMNTGYPTYPVNTGYPANIGYSVNPGQPVYTGYQGPIPQYPYSLPQSNFPGAPPVGVNVVPTIIFPPNMPPPYPPH